MFSHTKHTIFQLVLISALALFTELAVIRWLSSYILYLGYFTNIILIASFFGLGAGALIGTNRSSRLALFPILLLAVVSIVAFLKINIHIASGDILFFQSTQLDIKVPLELVAPTAFLIITLLFLPLGQRLGTLLDALPPLHAYTWDIIGSLTGIILFTLMSFLQTPPIVWFGIITLLYALIIPKNVRWLSSLVLFIPIIVLVGALAEHTLWSPYYKLTLNTINYADAPEEHGYRLLANSSGHQTLELPARKEFIYHQPYDLLDHPDIRRIMIIGAGGGSDVAIALERTEATIDAVEIDPLILDIGTHYHPSHPYAHDRVITHVTDGRAFLESTDNTYDLIIFALTDSLTLASSYSNTRLESYLYTQESFDLARSHLSPDGVVVLYNYYRTPWLIEKLAHMLEVTFDQSVLVHTDDQSLAILMAGPGLVHLAPEAAVYLTHPNDTYAGATDDWPFLYMKRPAFPRVYLTTLLSIVALAFILLLLIYKKILTSHHAQRTVNKKTEGIRTALHAPVFHWHFFWMGVGFLLLETKNVINFSLLFGSTWLVNALVFFAILFAVLIANLITLKFQSLNHRWLYVILGILLVLNLIIPLSALAPLPVVLRYIIASLLTFSPVIIANLIFASSFKHSHSAHLSFGSNLLGAVLGGLLEYASLLIGYHYILVFILVFYLFSFLSRKSFILEGVTRN